MANKISFFIGIQFLFLTTYAQKNNQIDIYQPPVMCVEEAVPSMPDEHIVTDAFGNHDDILKILKTNTNVAQLQEDEPSFESNWLLLNGAKDARSKINTVYAAANKYKMPPQVLVGALLQEASMVDLGISEDFGNWSCGIGQLNLLEWCNWANNETSEMKNKIKWPSSVIAKYLVGNPGRDICAGEFLRAAHVKPFHDIGLSRLRSDGINHVEFMLLGKHITEGSPISYKDVSQVMDTITSNKMHCIHKHRYDDECVKIKPSKNEKEAKYLRFLIAKNFAENCSQHENTIHAKAYTLKSLFDQLPADIKNSQKYVDDNKYQRTCLENITTNSTPLQVGWLLADVVYNAGQEIIPGIYKYKSRHNLSWEKMDPVHLVNAIDFTLRKKMYSKQLTKIGREEAHYHIRNVINNVTLPDDEIVSPYVSKNKNKSKIDSDDEQKDEFQDDNGVNND